MLRVTKTRRIELRNAADTAWQNYSAFNERCVRHEADRAAGRAVSIYAYADGSTKETYLNMFSKADNAARRCGA